jgi:PAS domain S-box-containing protein
MRARFLSVIGRRTEVACARRRLHYDVGDGVMVIDLGDSRFGRIASACSGAGRMRTLAAAAVLIAAIAFADWRIGLNVSLGALYTLPMILAALALPARPLLGVALTCAVLRILFDNPDSPLEGSLRFVLAFIAYSSLGLFVSALLRNHQQAMDHLAKIRREHELRTQAEEQVKALVESSPAAILTLDSDGAVLACNNSANELFGLEADESMEGKAIEEHLPVLREALRLDTSGEPFRTAAQSQGRRRGGEMFLADIWFSTYSTRSGKRLAAIVVDSSEEMREREEQGLRQLSAGSRILASAVLHEVRNLCSAFSVVYSNLRQRGSVCRVEDLEGLDNLVRGLARVASVELGRKEPQPLEAVSIQRVLDDLRIIVEPNWTEIGGRVACETEERMPRASADRHALLQVFLNLAQNSHRAVQEGAARELSIRAYTSQHRILVRFHDTGPGVGSASTLFRPFQQGAAASGLGLYISRALLRSFGGELRYEATAKGACFVVEVPAVTAEEEA